MTQRTKPPFRADHVGSLLRPKSLTEAFKKHRDGEIGDAELIDAQDKAIVDVVRLQEGAGLQSITDGEFRRTSYWGRFVERVSGLDVREALFTFHDDHGHEQAFTAPHVADNVRRTQGIALDEFEFLNRNTTGTAKITLPSPASMHFWRLDMGIEAGVYDDEQVFFADLADVYRQEIAALAALGASYVQIDDVPLAMLCDPAIGDRVRQSGVDPENLVRAYVDLFNDCVRSRPDGVHVAVHFCRGNYKGQFLSAGGYGPVAEALFNVLEADSYFLEYDSSRAGDFRPLKFVPKRKIVVLGLVSSKTPELETVDELRGRIDEAAKFLDLEQLCLSPQCGFASTIGGNPVTEEDERAKLELIVETADRVWH
ncbi:MAG: 5-methyltetrahydropteroyltriglutamate--homocysteine S-methyltransferase [Woeseiaceae bacterium]|nr:5-methyltetrahydropteroyltriglutamate--homocysteine S-methyltransferase [Woeseiaceae bacterium]